MKYKNTTNTPIFVKVEGEWIVLGGGNEIKSKTEVSAPGVVPVHPPKKKKSKVARKEVKETNGIQTND
jgi:hypothetical protein